MASIGCGIRVLHVTEAFGGGIASALNQYAQHMEFTSSFLIRIREGSSTGYELPKVNSSVSVPSLSQFVRQWFKHRQLEVDVVHVHSTVAGIIVRLFPHKTAAVVYSPHAFAYLGHKSALVRVTSRLLEQVLLRRTSAGGAVSEAEYRAFTALGLPSDRVVIVPHSIAVSEQKVTCPPNLQIIAVGRLSFQKNPEAFKSLKEKLNTSGVHASWLWVGGGEKRYEDLLTSAGIQVTGWVDPNEVASILERASIMFHPARYEGLPMAVLESMAAGVPVIASDIPAHQSLDSVFVYHDLLSAAAHVQVIANEQKWLKFSLLGQEEIKSKFGFENQKSALTALYSCALKFSINTSRLR